MKKVTLLLLTVLASAFCIGAQNVADTLWLDGPSGKLFTIIDRPDAGKTRTPLVIICHGFSANSGGYLMDDLSASILAQGMATLRFDFDGHGRSEGEFKDMTVPKEIDDLKAVVEWARAQKWVRDVALVGHSQGGVVVSMTSGELGDKIIRAEVLLAPAAVLRDDALRGNTMGAMYNPWDFKGEYVELPFSPGGAPLRLGRNYVQTAITLPIYETAAKYDGPALIMHGTYDQVVPYTYGERYAQTLKDADLRILPGENHGFSVTNHQTALDVAAWLHEKLF